MKFLLKLTSIFVLVGSAASNSYTFTLSSPTACDSSSYAITPVSVSVGCGGGACSVGDKLTVDSTCKKHFFAGLSTLEDLFPI